MDRRIILFTDSYPYGKAEQFLENELDSLAEAFDHIHIVPLHYGGSKKCRRIPAKADVADPLIPFEGRAMQVLRGLFNLAPVRPFLQDFSDGRVYTNFRRVTRWVEASSIVRILLRSRQFRALLESLTTQDLCYFYWGRGVAWILPFVNITSKKVVRFHGADVYAEREENQGYLPFRKGLIRSLDVALFVSEHGKHYMEMRYGLGSFSGRVSRLGVNAIGLSPKCTDGIFRIKSCSFMVPVKRLYLVVDALRTIDFPVSWIHIGDGPLRSEIESQAHSLPHNISATFLGHLENHEVQKHYESSPTDLFVNVSESEGLPVSVMEALAAGIPVMATDVGGTSELVDEHVGKLLPADLSPEKLASELEVVYRNPQRRAEKAMRARQRWEERASAKVNYAELSTYLLSLLEK